MPESPIVSNRLSRMATMTQGLQVAPLVRSAGVQWYYVVDVGGHHGPAPMHTMGVSTQGMLGQEHLTKAPPARTITPLCCRASLLVLCLLVQRGMLLTPARFMHDGSASWMAAWPACSTWHGSGGGGLCPPRDYGRQHGAYDVRSPGLAPHGLVFLLVLLPTFTLLCVADIIIALGCGQAGIDAIQFLVLRVKTFQHLVHPFSQDGHGDPPVSVVLHQALWLTR